MSSVAERIVRGRAAFLWACGLDVAVRKPGNVSLMSAGHAMEAEQFLASARAAAGPLFARGWPVGGRIEAAVAATRAAVGCNTNLGILLLCAPLAAALEHLYGVTPAVAPFARPAAGGRGEGAQLWSALRGVLAELNVDDAAAAYRAIALANPGGLGRAEAEDVADIPRISLRAAMALAAERDSVARQYASDFAEIFGEGLAALARADGSLATAVQSVFLCFLGGRPDSHIVRKLGAQVAQSVTGDAARWRDRLRDEPAAGESVAFAQWDERLKSAGINPGTSADLTVCTLFTAALSCPDLIGMAPDQNWHGSCIHQIGIGPFSRSDTTTTLPFGRA